MTFKVGDIVRQTSDHNWLYHNGLHDPDHIPGIMEYSDLFPKGTLFRIIKYVGTYGNTYITLTGPERTLYGMSTHDVEKL